MDMGSFYHCKYTSATFLTRTGFSIIDLIMVNSILAYNWRFAGFGKYILFFCFLEFATIVAYGLLCVFTLVLLFLQFIVFVLESYTRIDIELSCVGTFLPVMTEDLFVNLSSGVMSCNFRIFTC